MKNPSRRLRINQEIQSQETQGGVHTALYQFIVVLNFSSSCQQDLKDARICPILVDD